MLPDYPLTYINEQLRICMYLKKTIFHLLIAPTLTYEIIDLTRIT